jgi:hypothetical protein
LPDGEAAWIEPQSLCLLKGQTGHGTAGIDEEADPQLADLGTHDQYT